MCILVVRTYLVRCCDQYDPVLSRPHNVPVWSLGRSQHVPATYHYNVATTYMGITKLHRWNVIWYVAATYMVRSSYVVTT